MFVDRIKPLEKNRGVTLFPATLNNEKVIIIIPDRSGYGKTVIELMATFNIRETFGLKDGSTVTIVI